MSSIEKLAIVGVRSFSPQTQNSIEFKTPLTIILGANGAGKTTIIECLKYATTGELPPNSRAGAFVYDPKLAHETDVKALIKMKFKNMAGRTMIVQRGLLQTKKKIRTETKSVECMLQARDAETGEMSTFTGKLSEIEDEMEKNLGVAKAILENVIFCHQEDTQWPLSDSAAVKKKFDDIFSATKYIKAVSLLKETRKEKSQEVRIEEQKLDFLKTEKERAEKITYTREVVLRRIKDTGESLESLEGEVAKLEAIASGIREELRSVAGVAEEIEKLEREKASLFDKKAELGAVSVFEGTFDDLLSQKECVEGRAETAVRNRSVLMEQRQSKADRIEGLVKAIIEESKKVALAQASFQMKKVQMENKRVRLGEMQTRWGGGECGEDFLCFLEGKVEEKKKELDTLREHNKEKEKDARKRIQKGLNTEAVKEEHRRLREEEATETRAEMERTVFELEQTRRYSKEDLREKIAQGETQVEERRRERADFSQRALALKERLKRYEESVSDKGKMLVEFRKQAEACAFIKMCSGEIGSKQAEIGAVERAMALTGEAGTEDKTRYTLNVVSEGVSCLRRRLDRTDSELVLLESRKKTDEEALLQLRARDAEPEDTVDEAEEERLKREIGRLGGCVDMATAKDFLRVFNETSRCWLCLRGVEHGERKEFVDRVEGKIAASVVEREQKETIRGRLYEIQKRKTVLDEKSRHRKETIPQLEAAVRDAEKRAEDIAREREEIEKNIRYSEEEKEKLEKAVGQHRTRAGLEREVSVLKEKITTAEKEAGQGQCVRYEEIVQELETAQGMAQKIRTELQVLLGAIKESEEEAKRQCEELEATRSILSATEKGEERRHELEGTVEKQKEKITGKEREQKTLLGEIAELKSKIEGWYLELEEKRQSAQKEEEGLREALAALGRDLEEGRRCSADLRGFSLSGEEEGLRKSEGEIQAMDEECDQIRTDQRKIDRRLEAYEAEMDALKTEREAVYKIMEHREIESQIESVAEALRRKQREGRVTASITETKEKLRRYEQQQTEASTKRTGLLGEMKQLEHQRVSVESEFGEYAGVGERYRRQYLRAVLRQMATRDLDAYERVLDSSIMQYHAAKMEEINKVVNELWRNTYRGADIDTIEIRSEKTEGGGRRTYNYRVVLVKGEVVMDMRGRSSTGQRVLASLVIRLALAEAFGVNCGVFALDEPTTNLDKENIDGLVDSLVEIIKQRSRQRNFQFILITHDEEFVNKMCRAGCTDEYWRVFKDGSNNSMIERGHLG
ncbi:MAG: DNA repair protein Rad50 [Amphiamblys sp. WSBS2006]|nr:MAG: DNA repair protein Rad50 [Amphiamblys sp. WSBS2006]